MRTASTPAANPKLTGQENHQDTKDTKNETCLVRLVSLWFILFGFVYEAESCAHHSCHAQQIREGCPSFASMGVLWSTIDLCRSAIVIERQVEITESHCGSA